MDLDEQERYLEDARRVVKEQSYYMRSALEAGKVRDALKYTSAMLSELKTSLLGPKNYYVLYMQIFDEMRILESFFKDEYKKGRKMQELYEVVQHAGNIIPRLYLLITVGSVYIQTLEAPAKIILNDLLEMIKAVQHPLRGLFIRYYLLKMCKDRLPDNGSEYEGEGGNLNDALQFILTNLAEMNKLWIRMAGGKDKSKREKERIDLKVTIGENIVRISNMVGVNLEVYTRDVLPKLIEMITTSKDAIAQQYLMECIIQAFPDEYHLNNLEAILTTCSELLPQVDVKVIFIRLMDRLSEFIASADKTQSETITKGSLDIFNMFRNAIGQVFRNPETVSDLRRQLELQVAFLRFSLQVYPKETDYVNQILKLSIELIEQNHGTNQGPLDEDSLKNIVKLLTIPLDTLSITILSMDAFPELMKYLHFEKRKQVSVSICRAVVNLNAKIDSTTLAQQLINFIEPLFTDDQESPEPESFDFAEEQQLVARLLHLIKNEDPAVVYEILNLFKEKFLTGELKRMRYTIPPFIMCLVRLTYLVHRLSASTGTPSVDYNDIFTTAFKLLEKISNNNESLIIRLSMQVAMAINTVDKETKTFDELTYEIVANALSIYSDEISDTETKNFLIKYLVGSVAQLNCFSEENLDTIISNTAQFSSKLLKKPDQCLGVCRGMHLYVNNNIHNGGKLFDCFKRALKLAGISINSNIRNLYLYVVILNKFLYFLNLQVDSIKTEDVQFCLNLIKEKLPVAEQEKADNYTEITRYFENTLSFIRIKQAEGKFAGLEL